MLLCLNLEELRAVIVLPRLWLRLIEGELVLILSLIVVAEVEADSGALPLTALPASKCRLPIIRIVTKLNGRGCVEEGTGVA